MNHDEMGVRSDSLTFKFIYAKRRPSFLYKLILVLYKSGVYGGIHCTDMFS